MRSRPQLLVEEIRGNVDSRLARLEAGEFDGLLLAQAGLTRLGLAPAHTELLDVSEMLPAPAQGFLAIQTRSSGHAVEAVSTLDDAESRTAWAAERHLVRLLGADCALPVGAYARFTAGVLRLDAAVFSEDGAEGISARAEGDDPQRVAESAAEILIGRGADSLLAPYTTPAEAS